MHAHTYMHTHAHRHTQSPATSAFQSVTVLLPAFIVGVDNFAQHKLQHPTEKAGVFLSVSASSLQLS